MRTVFYWLKFQYEEHIIKTSHMYRKTYWSSQSFTPWISESYRMRCCFTELRFWNFGSCKLIAFSDYWVRTYHWLNLLLIIFFGIIQFHLPFLDRELFGNNFSGVIPGVLGNLTNLVSLDLYSNNFNGAIPDSLGNLSKLRFLYLLILWLVHLINFLRSCLFMLHKFYFFTCLIKEKVIWIFFSVPNN